MILEVSGLVKQFGKVHAVNGVDFHVAAGEAVGLVGESGSGKSTIGTLVTRLIAPTAGTIRFDGHDITALPEAEMRALRAKLQIVFQDPWGALNPRMTIGRALEEPLKLHTTLDSGARFTQVRELAQRVHLPPATLERFPNELSGGQLQRVSIARALATQPKLIVLDEPTSSLDLSVRAGILKLLDEIRRESGVAILFISHDLETVELVTDRVLVLYLGSVVEQGATRDIFSAPAHPYTQTLLSANLPPDPDARLARHPVIGETPSPIDLPPGCAFASRCPAAIPSCRAARPPATPLGEAHSAACIRIAEGANILSS
ncbi:MAG TPA: ABC transporter ATP-binding protein [Burkholderiales bacterium]|nr:ABC transporter ATP-binding protein [Burkholderiales bacterium]